MPEISGVNMLSTGDWVQRLLHSKINESLIDDLDADGSREHPTQFTKAQRHTVAYTNVYTHTHFSFFLSGKPVTSDVMCRSHEQYQAHHITALNGNKEIRNDIVL